MKQLFKKALLLGSLGAALTAPAQTEVDRTKYRDYSPVLQTDYRLASAVAQTEKRPDHVHNGQSRFFPPVFNQAGGSCGSASRVSYMFTHEINAYRDLDGSLPENYYPSHFSWLLTNGNSGKDEFVTRIGIPSAAIYGGQTYSKYFGMQDCEDDDFGWMQGYEKWFAAMHNRMEQPVNFPDNLGTEAGREAVKNFLWNHNGDPDFAGGGIVGVGVASTFDLIAIPSTPANDAAGLTGKKYIRSWGTQVDHAQTIVGYDDRVEFDLNGNGIYGEKSADEVGAWIVVNSWGRGWGDNGFAYCPYAYGGSHFKLSGSTKVFDQNSWWRPEVYHVRKGYRPLRTIKLLMEYTRRSELSLSAGVSTDLSAEMPERTVPFEHFKYAGDGNYGNTVPAPEVPMLGRWTDGLHREPMEFGYDLTDLTAAFDKSQPLKYFFIIETKKTAVGSGTIHAASIIDYEDILSGIETPFDLGKSGVSIQNAGKKTIISVVVQGQNYYAPQNFRADGGRLEWTAPHPSGNVLTGYKIRSGSELLATVGPEATSWKLPEGASGTFSLTAVYGTRESAAVNTTLQAEDSDEACSVDLTGGFTLKNVFDARYNEATIEFWIQPKSLTNWNQSAGPGWGNFMFHANADGSFTAGWNTGSDRTSTASSKLRAGAWTHVAIVVKDNKLTLYINATSSGSVNSSNYSGIGGFGDLVFHSGDAGDRTDACLQEIRIWKTARTRTDLMGSMRSAFGNAALPEDLVAYCRGDLIEEDGTLKLRERVSGNHAILSGTYGKGQSTASGFGVSDDISVSIDEPSGPIYAGLPATLSATASKSAASLRWTAESAGARDINVLRPSLTFATPGEHTVSVTAYNAKGTSATAERTLTVEEAPAPVADFRVSAEQITMDVPVSFIVNVPQHGYRYEWHMPGADTEYATTVNTAATYSKAGTYDVTLTVTSPSGRQATSSAKISVETVAPKADFDVAPDCILKGETTFLKEASRYQPETWSWEVSGPKNYFIDGRNSSLTVDRPGIYDVTLNVANAKGTDSKTLRRALTVCNADSKNGLNFNHDNARVTTADTPLPEGTEAFTIDWWMRPSALAYQGNGIGDANGTFAIYTTDRGLLALGLEGPVENDGKEGSPTSQLYSVFTGDNCVTPQEWHHYAVSFEAGSVQFFRDGELQRRAMHTVTALPAVSKFVIGQQGRPFSGLIDELRVWNRVLSEAELRRYANAPIEDVAAAERDLGLCLYYRFDQDGGDVEDATSHAHHGQRSGFGPEGDAWTPSLGVFSLSGDEAGDEDVTDAYLTNYKAPFRNAGGSVNSTNVSRFQKIADWTLENTVTNATSTAGAHVDFQKDRGLTITTGWDTFSALKDHKVYQSVTLPKGTYSFTANYGAYEGNPDRVYLVAARGQGLPDEAALGSALASTPLQNRATAMSHSVIFTLDSEETVSLGLLATMDGMYCVVIDNFSLVRLDAEFLTADNAEGHTLEVDASGWATLCVGYATAIPRGANVYAATTLTGSELMLSQVPDGILPARTAVIVEAEPGDYLFVPTTARGTATSLLSGTLADLSVPSGRTLYTLQAPTAAQSEPCLARFAGAVVPAHTAYLDLPSASAPDYITLQLLRTGLDALPAASAPGLDAAVYDLAGRRVGKAAKGLYIIGGRKYIVR